MARDVRGTIKEVSNRVSEQIAAFAASGRNGPSGHYARGLASEGYNGGYRDALSDVLLFLNGVRPNRNGWWEPRSKPNG